MAYFVAPDCARHTWWQLTAHAGSTEARGSRGASCTSGQCRASACGIAPREPGGEGTAGTAGAADRNRCTPRRQLRLLREIVDVAADRGAGGAHQSEEGIVLHLVDPRPDERQGTTDR